MPDTPPLGRDRDGPNWWAILYRFGEILGILSALIVPSEHVAGWCFAIYMHLQANREVSHGRIF